MNFQPRITRWVSGLHALAAISALTLTLSGALIEDAQAFGKKKSASTAVNVDEVSDSVQEAPPAAGQGKGAGAVPPAALDVTTELILDASGSMKQQVGQRTKLFQAKRVLRAFMLEAHQDNMVLGLRVYGLKEKDCKDTKLVLKFGEKGAAAIEGAMDQINPKGYGKTPLALSLTQAAEDLKGYSKKQKRIIVVTDGVDTCGGDPCKIAKLLAANHDLRIFVVGYTLNDDEREQIKCMADLTGGKYWDASDLNSLLQALKDLSNQDKNVFVKSPDPLGLSEVWQGGKKLRQFVSAVGTRLDPGVDYDIVVNLNPQYRFPHVKLALNEKRTLEVKGKGTINIHFMDGLFSVSLLNEVGMPVATFPSDTPTQVPIGFYKVKAIASPFAETLIDDVRVVPNGFYEETIKGFGALRINTEPERGFGPFGMYIFDDRKKQDIGSYLTGTPVVLPLGRYTIKSVGNSILRNVYPDAAKVLTIPLPPPGRTVTFSIHEKDKEAAEEEERLRDTKGPTMLDSLTPEQIQKHFEETQ